MELRIETLAGKKLIGLRSSMSFTNNRTRELWQRFMPRRKEIIYQVGTELYSLEVYDSHFFETFNPDKNFDKWAAVEVTNFNSVPADMETLLVPRGLYAVFIHKGPASDGFKTYQYIFGTWLPNAAFLVDNRPHFAVMGENYKRDDPGSEEQIWIPIKPKKAPAATC